MNVTFPRMLFGLVAMLVAAPAGAQPVAQLVEHDVVIEAGGGRRLAGTLTLPSNSSGPFPVALTLTGSGAHFRDGNRTAADPYRPFREIAAALATHGVATLRLDDRGVGGSTGDAQATTGDDVADDARRAIAWLRADPRIDPAAVAVIGHSFGGAVAPLVAAEDPRVAALVLMGAPARNFRETMRYQHRYIIEHDARIPRDRRAAALATAMQAQERNVAASAEAWRRWLQERDPLPTARRVRAPTLILHGLTDRAVSPEDARILHDAMRTAGNERVMLRLFDDVNHHFQRDSVGARAGYYQLPTQDLAPEFLAEISQWLAATLRQPSAR